MSKKSGLTIALKLPVVIVVIAAVATIVSGLMLALPAGDSFEKNLVDGLKVTEEARVLEMNLYLKSIEDELVLLAKSSVVRGALSGFNGSWVQFDNPEAELQKAYIDDNPNPEGQKHLLDQAEDGSFYSEFHGKQHPWFRELMEARGYYDIFLFNAKGDMVYSVFKE